MRRQDFLPKWTYLLALTLGATMSACSDDDEEPTSGNATEDAGAADLGQSDLGSPSPADAGETIPGRSVRFSVSYSGTEAGALVLALYTACPPAGPPIGFRVERIDNPVYPFELDFDNVEPGSYFAAATLDVGSDNPTTPGPEDLLACSAELMVSEDAGVFAPIDLDNPL